MPIPAFTQTPVTLYPWLAYKPTTVYGIAQQWFLPRSPFMSRFPTETTNAVEFKMVGHNFRSRVTKVVNAASATDTIITVADASILMNGDSVKFDSGEAAELVGAPDIVANTIRIARGKGGTTAAAITAQSTLFNMGNSRTGSEKFQAGISPLPSSTSQYVQTFQHIVSVSGLVQAVGRQGGFPVPPGQASPFDADKMRAMQNLVDDVEVSSLVGIGEPLSSVNARPKQKGLFYILRTTNLGPGGTANGFSGEPRNRTAYKPTDFEKDVLGPIRASGGKPALMMISNQFRTGLVQWGFTLQVINSGQTYFGVPVETYYSPFLGAIQIIENMWLDVCFPGSASAIVLTEGMIRYRVLEQLDFKAYGRQGDTGAAGEGDWIHRCGLEVDNEQMHGMVQGITDFATQT